jgi:hypothetical protein
MNQDTPGMPTHVSFLRVLINDAFVERTPITFSRDSLTLHVNQRFGKPEAAKARTWVEQMIDDLERRTCKGAIAPGTFLQVNHYPRPQVLREVEAQLAEKGIKLEISPLASEDGTMMAWIEYDRRSQCNK